MSLNSGSVISETLKNSTSCSLALLLCILRVELALFLCKLFDVQLDRGTANHLGTKIACVFPHMA